MRIRRSHAFALLGLSIAFAVQAHAALELTLQQKVTTDSGEFTFTTTTDREQDELQIDPESDDVESAATPSYRLWTDAKDFKKMKSKYFRYIFYVRRASGGPVTRVIGKGFSVGDFSDRMAPVKFTINDGATSEEGVIQLPIFGAKEPVSLSAKKYSEPIEVPLASDKAIPLTVQSEQPEMTVTVVRALVPKPGDGTLWEYADVNSSGRKEPVPIERDIDGATPVDVAELRLRPKPFQALASALLPSESAENDRIKVELVYKSVGRGEKTVSIEVPVVLKPWPPFLILMAEVGALLGSLVPASAKKRKFKDWRRAFGAAAGVAFLVESLSMLLKAKAGIIGLELDPYSLPGAMIIGFLVGMTGYRSLAIFRGTILPRFWQWKGRGGAGDEGGESRAATS